MRLIPVLLLAAVFGCADSVIDKDPERKRAFKPKNTDDIAEFDGQGEVVDQDIEFTDPVTAPLVAFEPTKQRIAIMAVEHAVRLFHATEGRYPKDYDEFMQRIVKENQLKIPEPGPGFRYEYDVASHSLFVVRDAPQQAPQPDAE